MEDGSGGDPGAHQALEALIQGGIAGSGGVQGTGDRRDGRSVREEKSRSWRRIVRVAVASDEKTPLTDFVVEELRRRGLEVVPIGPLRGEEMQWADAGLELGRAISEGRADAGVGFCWTGTGMSIAANKVPGIRAALCFDRETAEGARRWNDANVLVMSLRATSTEVAREMLDAFFSTEPEPSEAEQIAKVS